MNRLHFLSLRMGAVQVFAKTTESLFPFYKYLNMMPG